MTLTPEWPSPGKGWILEFMRTLGTDADVPSTGETLEGAAPAALPRVALYRIWPETSLTAVNSAAP
jgi:hypothetical protein